MRICVVLRNCRDKKFLDMFYLTVNRLISWPISSSGELLQLTPPTNRIRTLTLLTNESTRLCPPCHGVHANLLSEFNFLNGSPAAVNVKCNHQRSHPTPDGLLDTNLQTQINSWLLQSNKSCIKSHKTLMIKICHQSVNIGEIWWWCILSHVLCFVWIINDCVCCDGYFLKS